MSERYIIICKHEEASDPSKVTCYDSYEQALVGAVKFWMSYGLAYDATRSDPFFDPEWCDPECTNVYIHRDDGSRDVSRKGRLRYVAHEHGEGPTIVIRPEDAP